MTREELREKLAEQAHKSWAGWTRWMIDKTLEHVYGVENSDPDCIMCGVKDKRLMGVFSRWERQIKTAYEGLSEKEKDSDRKEADEYLEIIDGYLEEYRARISKLEDEIDKLEEQCCGLTEMLDDYENHCE